MEGSQISFCRSYIRRNEAPDELFGFRLFGHNMNTIGFPDVKNSPIIS
jgi:hypothetical protein